jgi:hypothetical protein
MFQIKAGEEMKTRMLCSITFPENRNEIVWKNTVEADRPQMAV